MRTVGAPPLLLSLVDLYMRNIHAVCVQALDLQIATAINSAIRLGVCCCQLASSIRTCTSGTHKRAVGFIRSPYLQATEFCKASINSSFPAPVTHVCVALRVLQESQKKLARLCGPSALSIGLTLVLCLCCASDTAAESSEGNHTLVCKDILKILLGLGELHMLDGLG